MCLETFCLRRQNHFFHAMISWKLGYLGTLAPSHAGNCTIYTILLLQPLLLIQEMGNSFSPTPFLKERTVLKKKRTVLKKNGVGENELPISCINTTWLQ